MKTQPLVKLIAFIVLLALIHGGISLLFPPELPDEIVRFDRYLDEGVDVLYLGDSTLMLPVGEVTTGEILQELLPGRRVEQVAHPAYGLDLFYDYTAYVDRHGAWPQTLIVPINLRSFSPAWDMRPAYQFDQERRILALGLPLARLLSRPLEVFGYIRPPISQQAFLDTPVYDGDVRVGQVRDFEALAAGGGLQEDAENENAYREVELQDAATARAVLTYHYMFNLEPDHRKLDAMVAVAELAAEHGVHVLFYITPVNVEQGKRFLGNAFTERFAENVQVVQSRLEAASPDNVTLLNMAFDLPAYDLTDTEHLTEPGKEYIAEQLARSIAAEPLQGGEAVADAGTSVEAPTIAAPTATVPPATATPVSPTDVEAAPTATPRATPSPTPVEPVTGGDVTSVRYIQRFRPSGLYPVDLVRISFETVDEFGEIVGTQADLYIPYVELEEDFPVLGHAAGTTGVGNGCAPLDERTTGRSWGAYHSQSLTYAAQGYIVVFPNWLYFDDPDRSHAYFVSELQAHTLLDAVRAAYRFWESDHNQALDTQAQPAQAALLMGYSSGGHAIFAAKDRARAYAPELPLRGVIGFGAVTNPGLLLREDPIFGPYLVAAYRAFYGEDIIDPAEVYLPRWVTDFDEEVLATCVDEVFYTYSHSARRMYDPEFREVLYDGRLADAYPAFAEKLAENTAGLEGGTGIPVLLLQGTADTVITPPSQRAFRDQLCALGHSVTWMAYEAATHADTRWRSFDDALAWMALAVQGSPRGDCPRSE